METDELSHGADPSGLPAGHGAKTAPRDEEIHQGSIYELVPPLRLVDDDYEPTPVAFDEQPPGLVAQWETGRRAVVKNQGRGDEENRPDRVHLKALETITGEEYVTLTQEARNLHPNASLRLVYAKAYELGVQRGLIKAA